MAKINVSKMLTTYVTDFGSTYTNLGVKWTTEAPVPTYYVDRVGVTCGANRLPFRPRYLKAIFSFGVHKYPVGQISEILTLKDALIALGASCIDLIGEKWGTVPGSILGNPTFKTTPYAAADVTGAGDKLFSSFDYSSDVLGANRLGTVFEAVPSALFIAARAAAAGTGTGKAPTPSSLGLQLRRFIMKADVDDDTTVARQSILSVVGVPTAANIAVIAGASNLLSYEGESATGVEGIATPAP
jgi:hypothetical protein